MQVLNSSSVPGVHLLLQRRLLSWLPSSHPTLERRLAEAATPLYHDTCMKLTNNELGYLEGAELATVQSHMALYLSHLPHPGMPYEPEWPPGMMPVNGLSRLRRRNQWRPWHGWKEKLHHRVSGSDSRNGSAMGDLAGGVEPSALGPSSYHGEERVGVVQDGVQREIHGRALNLTRQVPGWALGSRGSGKCWGGLWAKWMG